MEVLGRREHAQRDESEEPHNVIEQRFQDTLEEVFALKRILQEFLAEPTTGSCPAPLSPEQSNTFENRPSSHEPTYSELPFDSDDGMAQQLNESSQRVRASRGSERWLRRSAHFEPNFQARMHYYMMKREQHKFQLQAEVHEKQCEDLKLAPTINQRSKRINRRVKHLHAWNREKEIKIAELREAKQDQEQSELTHVPRIARRSEKLVATRADDIASCKVEDRLHLLGLIYEYQQEERKLLAEERERQQHHPPPMARHSVHLQRSNHEPAHKRLHKLSRSAVQTAKSEDLATQSFRRTKPKATVDAAIRRLVEQGEIYNSNRQELAAQLETRIKTLQRSTKISEASCTLAHRARARASQHECAHHRKCTCCQPEIETPEDPPAISSTQALEIYERQLKWKQAKEDRCKAERERLAFLKEADLIFRNPHYRSAWAPLQDNEEADGPNGAVPPKCRNSIPNDAFFKKSLEWAKAKELQVEAERMRLVDAELRECTFRPAVNHVRHKEPRQQQLSPQAFLKTANDLGRGYFSRMATPMLSLDASNVSSDDGVDSLDSSSVACDHHEPHVVFIDNGVRRH